MPSKAALGTLYHMPALLLTIPLTRHSSLVTRPLVIVTPPCLTLVPGLTILSYSKYPFHVPPGIAAGTIFGKSLCHKRVYSSLGANCY